MFFEQINFIVLDFRILVIQFIFPRLKRIKKCYRLLKWMEMQQFKNFIFFYLANQK